MYKIIVISYFSVIYDLIERIFWTDLAENWIPLVDHTLFWARILPLEKYNVRHYICLFGFHYLHRKWLNQYSCNFKECNQPKKYFGSIQLCICQDTWTHEIKEHFFLKLLHCSAWFLTLNFWIPFHL